MGIIDSCANFWFVSGLLKEWNHTKPQQSPVVPKKAVSAGRISQPRKLLLSRLTSCTSDFHER